MSPLVFPCAVIVVFVPEDTDFTQSLRRWGSAGLAGIAETSPTASRSARNFMTSGELASQVLGMVPKLLMVDPPTRRTALPSQLTATWRSGEFVERLTSIDAACKARPRQVCQSAACL